MMDGLAQRAASLVAEPGYAELLARLRERLERGGAPQTVLLRGLGDDERRALADLLSRPDRLDATVRVRLEDIDASLRSSRVAAGLVEVLEALHGPLRDRRAEREAAQRRWDELFADLTGATAPKWRREWVDALRRGTLKRLTDDVDAARVAAQEAEAVLALLPAEGLLLADLAARATGDPHALDPGRGGPLPVLVLSAVAVQLGLPPDQPTDARDRRDLWAAFGVQCDPLSSTTLMLGFDVMGVGLLADTLRGHAAAGEPLRVTLRQVQDASLRLPGGVLHVCENPSVVAAAADRLGPNCRPLLCVEGVPSTATHAVLDALGEIDLRIHADFDAGGVRIGNLLHRRQSAAGWRFGTADYLAGLAAVNAAVPLPSPVEQAVWDPELASTMAAQGRVLYEEQVLGDLLDDLRRRTATHSQRAE